MLDAIADKALVNSVLIILAGQNMISAIIPVIVVLRDIVVKDVYKRQLILRLSFQNIRL